MISLVIPPNVKFISFRFVYINYTTPSHPLPPLYPPRRLSGTSHPKYPTFKPKKHPKASFQVGGVGEVMGPGGQLSMHTDIYQGDGRTICRSIPGTGPALRRRSTTRGKIAESALAPQNSWSLGLEEQTLDKELSSLISAGASR